MELISCFLSCIKWEIFLWISYILATFESIPLYVKFCVSCFKLFFNHWTDASYSVCTLANTDFNRQYLESAYNSLSWNDHIKYIKKNEKAVKKMIKLLKITNEAKTQQACTKHNGNFLMTSSVHLGLWIKSTEIWNASQCFSY